MEYVEYLVFILLGLLIPLYVYYNKIQKQKIFLNNFPSPPGNFLLGNALEIAKSGFLNTLIKITKEYGSMIHLRLGFNQVLMTSDYDFLQFMLSSTNNKSFHRAEALKYLKPWIGNGLILAEDEQWKIHRRLITPAFNVKILESFVEMFESSNNVLIQKLSEIKNNKSVDIHPYILRCAFSIICETAMGIKVDVQNDETSSYFQNCNEMARIFVERAVSPLKGNDFYFRFTKDYVIQKESLECIHGYAEKVINLKRKKLTEKKQMENNHIANGTEPNKEKKVFVDILLEAEEKILSNRELRDEINTFMLAGHDTTAAGTSFVLHCLSGHPNVQDKILEEQKQIFGDIKNPKVTYANLQEMKYLENAIKEGMRLYPPLSVSGRKTSEEITYNGMVIPKDMNILIYLQGLHMNPKYFPDPEKYDPERFQSNEAKHPFMPFSIGPRNCIGQKYAMLEMKSVISKIIRHFELSPAVPQHIMKLESETTLKSLNGIKMGLKLR